jgi:hypothetical protein
MGSDDFLILIIDDGRNEGQAERGSTARASSEGSFAVGARKFRKVKSVASPTRTEHHSFLTMVMLSLSECIQYIRIPR